ncbi:Probable inactive purple acid phosphatase [Seminavis robusta]|uniref:Purple acid phosphatase n=1 Tax=Seminavis robusta TaxID=568900 RepID=A0A9N8DYY3_9STRA|nr:Probable inactive purple acid phosphatase [Seminavis robusta]|eukprot:Sro353_g124490.1 Probable inactive purple acid phosphatase (687) ;mRNA; r:34271-36331
MMGRRNYEALVDREDQQLQKQLLRKSWWIMAVVAMAGGVAIFCSSSHSPNSHQHQHTIPTLLSVVHHETGDYLVALNNPVYERLKKAKFHDTLLVANNAKEIPSLHVNRYQIGVRDPLTLHWTLGQNIQGEPFLDEDKDLITLHCGDKTMDLRAMDPSTDFLDAATIAQARSTSCRHSGEAHPQKWHIPSFPILRHEICQFALYKALPDTTDGQPQYALLDRTDPIEIESSRTLPTGIHLALGSTPNEMVVQFTSGDVHPHFPRNQEGTPVARYSKQGSKDDAQKATGTSHTYSAKDMCEAPANITEAGKFQSPGMIHVIRLVDLEPNTAYEYKVGLSHGQGITWSDSYSFLSPPLVTGDAAPHSYLVYGDQGCPATGWGDGGKWVAAMTAREVLNPKDKNQPIRSVHHFGDLSYAVGAAHIWDAWLNMISPFTTKVPLMVAVGNHEYDHLSGGGNGKDPSGVKNEDGYRPTWGNFVNDSGGECGVPTSNYFTMPNSTKSNGVFWYSYDFANVHTTVISSEHDLAPGSVQYQWLEADLRSVNRTLTPWLIVESHRPLYESQINWENNDVGIVLRLELDDLLVDYKVDVVLTGHYHAYLRTCDGLHNAKCHNGGPIHLTIGSAGAAFLDTDLYSNSWTDKFIKNEFGYGRITVANATALHFEFVKAGDSDDKTAGEVHDEVWIVRER